MSQRKHKSTARTLESRESTTVNQIDFLFLLLASTSRILRFERLYRRSKYRLV